MVANLPAVELKASGPARIVFPTSLACNPVLAKTILKAVSKLSDLKNAVTGGLITSLVGLDVVV
ncbi:MAG: hypothetical protein VKP63_06915 [Cyanobacteriota bacterium]|nr:hypothetical protein [Cyanobacteriota bacterium]